MTRPSTPLGIHNPSISLQSQPIPTTKADMAGPIIPCSHQPSSMFQTTTFTMASMISLIREVLFHLTIPLSPQIEPLEIRPLHMTIHLLMATLLCQTMINMGFLGPFSKVSNSRRTKQSHRRHFRTIQQDTSRQMCRERQWSVHYLAQRFFESLIRC